MMSASEFFDCGPDPPWLVDACDGEIVSPNFELELSYLGEASTFIPSLNLNYSIEAGPSNSAMHMDLDEVRRPNDPYLAHNPRQEFERFLHDANSAIQSVRRPVGLPLDQQISWLSTVTPSRVTPRRLATSPAPDVFFRACKKRKRSYA